MSHHILEDFKILFAEMPAEPVEMREAGVGYLSPVRNSESHERNAPKTYLDIQELAAKVLAKLRQLLNPDSKY